MNTASRERRVLGRISGTDPGSTLICVAGIHGNEPAGISAIRRVTQALQATSGVARGDYVALTGNLAALARERCGFVQPAS